MNNFDRRLDSYFAEIKNDISTNENIPISKMIKFTNKKFSDDWKSSFLYSNKNSKEFKSKKIDDEIILDINFLKHITYISHLFDYLLTGHDYGIEKWIINEMEEWEIKGGICIYLSVLLYSLLSSDFKICSDCLKYVQGFYRHEIREDYPSFMPWAGQHNGIHAWLTLNDSIIDISIRQQERFFDFKGNPIILGDIPEGLTYIGTIESKTIVNAYLADILNFSKENYHIWIKKHTLNAINLTLTKLKEDQECIDNLIIENQSE